MAKRLSIIGILLIAVIYTIAKSKSSKSSVESNAISRQHLSPNGIKIPARPNTRQRSSDLTLDSLCERLSKAEKIQTGSQVFQKILSQLSDLDSAHLIAMLGRLNSASCGGKSRSTLEQAIVSALGSQTPELALDYVLSRDSEEPGRWNYFIEGNLLLGKWDKMTAASLAEWLDARRELLHTDKSTLIGILETSLLTKLVQTDPATAMKRARALPESQALAIIGNSFRQRSDLLGPDEAINFLRESLNRVGHEELVGITCGRKLYPEGLETLQSFFRKHDASRAEKKAILFKAVGMQVNMGGQGPTDEFIQRTRQFAEDEDVGNADELTAVILGTTADRDHEDKRAVDQLLSYNPGPSAIQIFLKARGNSLDTTQARRIEDYLDSSDGRVK